MYVVIHKYVQLKKKIIQLMPGEISTYHIIMSPKKPYFKIFSFYFYLDRQTKLKATFNCSIWCDKNLQKKKQNKRV